MNNQEMSAPPHLITLILLVSFGTVCAVLFTPALPEVAHHFQISDSKAGWSMTIYLIGYAIGQLPYGPLANRFGRKEALLLGVLLSLVGTLCCLAAGAILFFPLFLVGRLFMALGACVGLMMAFTLINDFYPQNKARTLSSYMMLAFAIMPGLSLTMGGALTYYFGWQACFYALMIYGLGIGVLVSCCVHNPIHLQKQTIAPLAILKAITGQLKRPALLAYASVLGCCAGTIYIFATLAPFVAQQIFNLSENTFGTFSLIPSIGILLGATASGKLSGYINGKQLIKLGVLISFIGGCLMGSMLYCFEHALALFVSMALINFGQTMIMSNASVLATQGSDDKANAASLMSFLNLSLGAFSVWLVQCLPLSTALIPSALIILSLVMGGILCIRLPKV